MQPVAEFVEQRAGVVEGQKRRLAGRALGEVHHIDDQRPHVLAASPRVILSWVRSVVIQAPLRLEARAK